MAGSSRCGFAEQNAAAVIVAADAARRFADYELLEEPGPGRHGGCLQSARRVSLDRIVAAEDGVAWATMASAADLARFRSEAEAAAATSIIPRSCRGGRYEGRRTGWATLLHDEVRGPATTLAQEAGRMGHSRRVRRRHFWRLWWPRAIHFAHTRGVLHRDLKPSNILIDAEGRPHVSDFGLAKRVEGDSNLTLTGAILGTPAHMAPEQAAGSRGKLGPTSDVYSLGTILYQMLTGRPPFQAASPVDTVLLVLEQDPLPPRLVNPRADRELERIAAQAPLPQKPQDFAFLKTAKLLADDLDAFLARHLTDGGHGSGIFTQVLTRSIP